MCAKRSSNYYRFENKAKRSKNGNTSVAYFHEILKECGLELKPPPEKCMALQETPYIITKLKKYLMEHEDSVQNTKKIIDGFKNDCYEPEKFEHYIVPTVIQVNCNDYCESVIKILLNITTLQSELIEYIFNKILDLLHRSTYDHLVKNILRVFSSVDTVEHNHILSNKLIELINTNTFNNKSVKQEVLSAIPDVIVECEHDKVAFKLIEILSANEPLIPSILDCLTYLCLSDVKFEHLHNKTLETMPSKEAYFCYFVKFLLTPGRLSANTYEKTITTLRSNLHLQPVTNFDFDTSNQLLTAKAIRYSMISSKIIAKTWLKVISNCDNTHHKPIDIILFLILYSISDEMQKEVEKKMRIQIKSQRLKEDLLEDAFKSFKPILSSNLGNLICLSNALLKTNTEPVVQSFASRMYLVMFSELKDHSRTIVAGLLRLIINCKQSILIALSILNNIASKNWTRLMSQTEPILTLLEEMDDVTLTELKAIMNLVCGLAYGYENSMIRNKVHISITKQLGSSIPSTKIRGILTGIYAVKYLMNSKDFCDAKDIIECINQSTKHYPDMTVFFYHELSEIIQTTTNMDSGFREWLVEELTNKWKENFVVNTNYNNTIGEVRLTQLSLDENFKDETQRVVNIANLTLEHIKDKNIVILSPLFRLIGLLHCRSEYGNLSSIQEVLDYVIVMPVVDVNSIDELTDHSAAKTLDCCIHCINFIHEMLNIFGLQKNETLKPKIFKRIHQLREQEILMNKILLIKELQYKPPAYYPHAVDNLHEKVERRVVKSQAKKGKKIEQSYSSLTGNSKTQQTNVVTTLKNAYITNIRFRPLNVNLFELLQYDLKLFDAPKTELTIDILSYLLYHLICTLEKSLLPRIKRKTFLDKDDVQLYNPSDAEIQAKTVNSILSKLMVHLEVIMKFLDCHLEDDTVDFDSDNALQIMESFLCLQRIYDLLSVYFKWFELKERQMVLLKTSLKTIANEKNDTSTCMEYLVTTVMKKFQKHEKYCITLSSAVSLIKLMWAFKEHSSGSSETLMIKELARNFLSKKFNEIDDELEKGPIYNQHIAVLSQMYFANSKLIDLKTFVKSLINDVDKLRDSTSSLVMLKNINKSNIAILFRNLGLALFDKIKAFLKANDEVVDNWGTVAIILKFMSEIVKTLNNKYVISSYSKIFNVILKIFNTKGFSVLKTQFQQNRELIETLLKDFNTSMEHLKSTSQSSHSMLMKKIPSVTANLTCFTYKTKELLGETVEQNSRRRNKKTQEGTVYAAGETIVDYDSPDDSSDDDHFPDDEDFSSDFNQNDYLSACI